MMELLDVAVGHGRRTVVDGLSATLAPGTAVGLLGPNGAGKSTLLAAMAGLRAPQAGRIRWRGRSLAAWPRRALARERAVLDQHDPLDFPLRVEEVVAMGRHPHGPGPTDRRRVQAALARVDAGHLRGRAYPTLSGGERQRVRLARALCQLDGPGLLLLDEPLSAQDLARRQRLVALMRDLAHRDGHLVVCVVHDPNAAAHLDRLLLLAHGRCIADGPPTEALAPDPLRRAFALDCTLHRLDGRLVVLPAVHPSEERC